MSQNPCLHVLNKSLPLYLDFEKELDYLHLCYSDLIVSSLASMRGMATDMYLADRFLTKRYECDIVGSWNEVRAKILEDVECFRNGHLPSDMADTSWTAKENEFYNFVPAYKRLNTDGVLELVTDLMEFVKTTDEVDIDSDYKVVVRHVW